MKLHRNFKRTLLVVLTWLAKDVFDIDCSNLQNIGELKVMITIHDNQPDGTITVGIDRSQYVDEEGAVVPVSLADPTTDNPSSFDFPSITNSGDSLTTGTYTGAPGLATINFAVTRDDNGEVVQNQAYVINVIPGNVTAPPAMNINLGDLPPDA